MSGEPFRGHDDSGRPWREEDLPALGWRHRRHYDMRAAFITLAIEDGADPEILETRVTHTRKSRNAFDGYNRGLHWPELASIRCISRQSLQVGGIATKDLVPLGWLIRRMTRSATLWLWNLVHFAWSMVRRAPWTAADRSET